MLREVRQSFSNEGNVKSHVLKLAIFGYFGPTEKTVMIMILITDISNVW